MKIVHVKSPCCQATVRRFGGKRRQCRECRKTFRIRPRRRGRRRVRHIGRYVRAVFHRDFLVKHLTHGALSLAAVQKRFQQALTAVVSKPRSMRIRGRRLILIVDGRWHTFQKRRWTMYFLAIKSVDQDTAIVFDPILLPGRESAEAWREIISTRVPPSVKNRIVALVSDGLAGGTGLANDFGWHHQRCHFHLLKELEKRRGKRKRLPGWNIREQIYWDIRELLRSRDTDRTRLLTRRLKCLSLRKECPRKIRMIVNDAIDNLSAFRLYLVHPEWNLPNTTSMMESLGNRIRAGVGKVRTPDALIRWATAVIRSHPKFVCKRTKYQPN